MTPADLDEWLGSLEGDDEEAQTMAVGMVQVDLAARARRRRLAWRLVAGLAVVAVIWVLAGCAR